MYDTPITIVGTVLTQPEKRYTNNTGTQVTSFRVVSNRRRFDKESGTWVDASSLRLRVNCWRRLAEGVADSVSVGDPVIVHGRIDTKDWKTEQGEARMAYEVDAFAVGHDLARGRAVFTRGRGDGALVVEDADEPPVPTGLDALDGHVPDDLYTLGSELENPAELSLSLESTLTGEPAGGDEDDDEDAIAGVDAGPGGTGGRSRRRGRQPVPA